MSDLHDWLVAIADTLIPAADGMPAASEVDIAGTALKAVLTARPDLERHLARAFLLAGDIDKPQEALDSLQQLDAAAYEAILMIVTGGYYMNSRVRELLGYTGQQPQPVRIGEIPEYVSEGLLDRVMARGPRYRDPEVKSVHN